MAEISQRLLARPITLEYIDGQHTIFISAVISMASTVLSADPLGDLASVELVLVKHTDRWALIFQHRLLAIGRNVPAPRYLADVVSEAHAARRSAAPENCRGPVDPPSHLW